MTYSVKEIFKTLQGEGAQSGRAAVFCRFAGCNLWSGREADRESAICQFCDTEFVGTDGVGGGANSPPPSTWRTHLQAHGARAQLDDTWFLPAVSPYFNSMAG